jgi:hypothetical protein
MIHTVADFLHQLKETETSRLDDVEIRHGPTIGDMYEGLSADLLRRAIPDALGLQLVTGFVSDSLGGLSSQIDCMLVRGQGDPLPYTDAYVWPVKDVIAVFEIKKTLYHEDLVDAFRKLRSIKHLDWNYKISLREAEGFVDIRSANRSFAETTRLVAPTHEELDSFSLQDQLIFHTLVGEQLCPVGIAIGYHGYATEQTFRESLLRHLEVQVNSRGYGPGSFPQLMISGRYSLGKANGQPYSSRVQDGWWPFYFSSRVNPLLLLLEYVWTRLDMEFGIGGLWGEDLEVEKLSPFLLTQAAEVDGHVGWRYESAKLTEADLEASEDLEPWEPEVLSPEQFAVISRLCDGFQVSMADSEFREFLDDADLDPAQFKIVMLDTGLVAMAGDNFELITDRCQPAFMPDGRFVAGEDNTGRMTRWITQHTTAS